MADSRSIAGVQSEVTFADPAANLARMVRWLGEDSVRDCDLVVFPECMLSGYCFDSLEEALPSAESIPGPATKCIADLCSGSKRHVIFGMLERGDHGQLFNSSVLIGPAGIIGVYRKIHLPHLGVDRFVTAGSEAYRVWQAGGMKIGMHICYDASFPESSRVLSLLGADLLVLPTNWPPGAATFAQYLPNARALENNVFFLAVNRVGTERGFRFIGQSRLCDTNGNSLVDGPEKGEMVLRSTIDLAVARNKRLERVPKLHVIDRFADRRPEFYGALCDSHGMERRVE